MTRIKSFRAERKLWLAEHPGRTSAEFTMLLQDPASEVYDWRRAAGKKEDRAMRRAWLRDHPGEEPLPKHLCALDHPYPGFKRWAAKAKRWIEKYNEQPK